MENDTNCSEIYRAIAEAFDRSFYGDSYPEAAGLAVLIHEREFEAGRRSLRR
jgi:hypothetical protein